MKQIVTTSTQPYFIRALYEWMRDNGLTPYLTVDTTITNVMVPPQGIKDGQITLNISPSATHQLVISNDDIRFSARFGGVSHQLFIPIHAVQGIFARETGQGLFFEASEVSTHTSTTDTDMPNVDVLAISTVGTRSSPKMENKKPRGKQSLRVLDD